MIKLYKFNHRHGGSAEFEVDTEVFTEEKAKELVYWPTSKDYSATVSYLQKLATSVIRSGDKAKIGDTDGVSLVFYTTIPVRVEDLYTRITELETLVEEK